MMQIQFNSLGRQSCSAVLMAGLVTLLNACGGGNADDHARVKKCLDSGATISNCLKSTPSVTPTPSPTMTPTPPPSLTLSAMPSQKFIQIAPNIKLEVLDFGGSGDVILLLAGAGNTAHVFDGFAQGLTAKNRVFALTRRGYGGSSQPATGYDTATLTEDIRSALDQLGIQRVHLIGHSIAGDEISRFAGKYPERVNRLVYLDAAYDRIALNAALSSFTLPSPPELTIGDLSSLDGLRQYTHRIRGVAIPKAEIEAAIRLNSDGSVANAVTPDEIAAQHLAGVETPNYSLVKARALGIFADAQNPSDIVPWLTPASPEWAANSTFFTQVYRPYLLQQQNKFKTELIGSRSLNIAGANHYLFISHAKEVTAAIAQFLAAP